jgi:hypothetical protein
MKPTCERPSGRTLVRLLAGSPHAWAALRLLASAEREAVQGPSFEVLQLAPAPCCASSFHAHAALSLAPHSHPRALRPPRAHPQWMYTGVGTLATALLMGGSVLLAVHSALRVLPQFALIGPIGRHCPEAVLRRALKEGGLQPEEAAALAARLGLPLPGSDHPGWASPTRGQGSRSWEQLERTARVRRTLQRLLALRPASGAFADSDDDAAAPATRRSARSVKSSKFSFLAQGSQKGGGVGRVGDGSMRSGTAFFEGSARSGAAFFESGCAGAAAADAPVAGSARDGSTRSGAAFCEGAMGRISLPGDASSIGRRSLPGDTLSIGRRSLPFDAGNTSVEGCGPDMPVMALAPEGTPPGSVMQALYDEADRVANQSVVNGPTGAACGSAWDAVAAAGHPFGGQIWGGETGSATPSAPGGPYWKGDSGKLARFQPVEPAAAEVSAIEAWQQELARRRSPAA